MAFTRKFLAENGVPEDKIDLILAERNRTLKDYTPNADVQAQIDAAIAAAKKDAPEPQDPDHFPIWDTFYELVEKAEGNSKAKIGYIERFAFYDKSREAYAVIATGEQAVYANVMIQKGVITPDMLG